MSYELWLCPTDSQKIQGMLRNYSIGVTTLSTCHRSWHCGRQTRALGSLSSQHLSTSAAVAAADTSPAGALTNPTPNVNIHTTRKNVKHKAMSRGRGRGPTTFNYTPLTLINRQINMSWILFNFFSIMLIRVQFVKFCCPSIKWRAKTSSGSLAKICIHYNT